MNPYQISNDDQSKYVHLKVTELARSMDFYVDLLGFKIILAYEDHTATYLSAGSHHYLLALDTWFLSIYPNLKLRVPVFFIPSSNIQPKKI
jgi:catechol 2,3-dioxygenase